MQTKGSPDWLCVAVCPAAAEKRSCCRHLVRHTSLIGGPAHLLLPATIAAVAACWCRLAVAALPWTLAVRLPAVAVLLLRLLLRLLRLLLLAATCAGTWSL